nr:immunoglobulin light chain junction region [Macaca mulatta]MOW30084.1 immunoglobulin light chain junction region [Macaca mulatta]MOW30292.1 immunoglobulin light chain junction region [Macaca mulatta]
DFYCVLYMGSGIWIF